MPRRAAQTYRGLPVPVRLAAWSVFAIAVGYAIGSTAPIALRGLGAVIALQPGILPWYFARALGFLAYLAFAGSVVYGLMLSTKLLDAIAHRPISIALHKDLSLAGVALSVLHGAFLLADHTFAFTPFALLVPFASPYAPVAVGIGQLAFYLAAAVTASFYARRRIGPRAWRLLHYLTFVAFAGVAVHGIASGTDTREPWAFWLYVAPMSIAVFLFGYRAATAIALALRSPTARPAAPIPAGLRPAAPTRSADGAPFDVRDRGVVRRF